MSAIDYATVRANVIIRDDGRCVLCKRRGQDVHEILPRSRFGASNKDNCFIVKNMVCICRDCHAMAHTIQKRIELLNYLKTKYKYDYNEEWYQRYVSS